MTLIMSLEPPQTCTESISAAPAFLQVLQLLHQSVQLLLHVLPQLPRL